MCVCVCVCAHRFQSTSPNIFYTQTGEVVYFAAAVGIVYNKDTHTQVRPQVACVTNVSV